MDDYAKDDSEELLIASLKEVPCSLRIDPLFKGRNGLRNNEQKLATVSSRFLEVRPRSHYSVFG